MSMLSALARSPMGKDLLEFVKNKMPDYDIQDIFNVDSGGFDDDGIIIVDVVLN